MLTILPLLVLPCLGKYGITRLFYLFRHGEIGICRFFLVDNSRICIRVAFEGKKADVAGNQKKMSIALIYKIGIINKGGNWI